MEIIKANKDYSKQISKMMLKDLESPPKEFSKDIIDDYRNHAQIENIIKEFDNPNLFGFLAIENDQLKGFVVSYIEDNSPIIHYITSTNPKIKKELLIRLIKESKAKDYGGIIADSFDFMDNDKFYEEMGLKIYKKERLDNGLILLWRRLNFNKEKDE